MDISSITTFLKNKAPVLFNYKGLDDKGIARIEQSVKSAKDTLALADQLQTMRDVNKTLQRISDSLRKGGNLSGSGRKLIDFGL